MNYLKKYYAGKTVLVTGHTGFKGSWLSMWLTLLGAKVIGVSNEVPTQPSNFEVSEVASGLEDHRIDVTDADAVKKIILDSKVDYVFHLAAQALVRPSYESPLQTLQTNTMGTANILDALRFVDHPVVAVMITSDKAYDNVEWTWVYRENDRLGGKDPYSASKGMAELVIRSYVQSFFQNNSHVKVGVTRAGNVIGGGDWAVDRIIPDCVRAWAGSQSVDIRSPHATRPWQHVLEPLSGYLLLGATLFDSKTLNGEAYNFGPAASQNVPVSELINEMEKSWNSVRWSDVSVDSHVHEAGLLKLNCDKALSDLGWLPTLKFEETVAMTANWYKAYYDDEKSSMPGVTIKQIQNYVLLAKKRGLQWAK